MTSVASLLDRSSVLAPMREPLRQHDPWLVGGGVRDLLMGRPLDDVDMVVAGDAQAAAIDLARAVRGHAFSLSERFGAWRVIDRDRRWQSDITPVRGGGIDADLALRDFTINAMAVPLIAGEPLQDPHGGRADLDARVLRVVSERSYADDPLRTLRMPRLACELELEVEQTTRTLAARHAPGIASVSGERVFYELRRLVLCERVLDAIALMDEAGLVAELLPELEQTKGVGQNPYHHLDVWGHTLAVLEATLELERDPERVLGEHTEAVTAELARPLGDELTRGQALRFGALLHDIGKPRTRTVAGERVMFLGHDEVGAAMTREVCERLRTSGALADYLAALARHHLRLGFLVHEQPLSRRHVYRYLRACEPVELEVTLLTVADRLATRGERTREEAVQQHLALARGMAGEALAWRASPPRPPLRGDDLIRELGLEPGPRVGELLELLREAAFAGEISSREQALELVRRETAAGG
jgi:poly(A) polymerase